MTAATRLSRYCAYLVMAALELLPDRPAWTKKWYKQVEKDVTKVLDRADASSMSPADRYEGLVIALSQGSRETVLQQGAEIGQNLVKEYARDQASACAKSWRTSGWRCCSTSMLPPQKMSRATSKPWHSGGEFMTPMWALLLHMPVLPLGRRFQANLLSRSL
ncbi:hypothetical protein PR202_ga22958 [Eleusine coracana subsp. coracana]|uniref:Uncharacterized protein n=1 Tax=Eleusine coracana subsp. coracana TaxID=191504 RepID=A0AAV5D5D7_ELECO|nr:hypothetical protein PR202_ga22958 [Eleusine coracana subsp. coracana]